MTAVADHVTRHLQDLLQRQHTALTEAQQSLCDLKKQVAEAKAPEARGQGDLEVSIDDYDIGAMQPAQPRRCRRFQRDVDVYRNQFVAKRSMATQNGTHNGSLDDVVVGDRSVARLWDSWSQMTSGEIGGVPGPKMNEPSAFARWVGDLNPSEMTLPQRSRLTGGFEMFLTQVMGVQATLGATMFNTPTKVFWRDMKDDEPRRPVSLGDPNRRIGLCDAKTRGRLYVTAGHPSLPDRIFARTDVWEPDSFTQIEAFLSHDNRTMTVLHDRSQGAGRSGWLQKLANQERAAVFAL